MKDILIAVLCLMFFGGGGLYLLYGIVKRPPAMVERLAKAGKDIGSPLYKLAVLGCFAFCAVFVWMLMGNMNSPQNPSNVKDEASAKAFVLGTWTYTEPLNKNSFYGWQKIVFKEDGTVDLYNTSPASDDWGKPMAEKYKVEQRKYTDTGARYWAADTGWSYIIHADGTLRFNVMDGSTFIEQRVFKRGDKNPFK